MSALPVPRGCDAAPAAPPRKSNYRCRPCKKCGKDTTHPVLCAACTRSPEACLAHGVAPRGHGLCRHCAELPADRRRGLCWRCYYDPVIRALHPSTSNHANRGVADDPEGEPDPVLCPDCVGESPDGLCQRCRRACDRFVAPEYALRRRPPYPTRHPPPRPGDPPVTIGGEEWSSLKAWVLSCRAEDGYALNHHDDAHWDADGQTLVLPPWPCDRRGQLLLYDEPPPAGKGWRKKACRLLPGRFLTTPALLRHEPPRRRRKGRLLPCAGACLGCRKGACWMNN